MAPQQSLPLANASLPSLCLIVNEHPSEADLDWLTYKYMEAYTLSKEEIKEIPNAS